MGKHISIFAVVLTGLAIAGCKPDPSDTDVSHTGDTGATDGHPLVPEKYKYLWNTGACTTTDGKEGIQVYILVDEGDGEAQATGKFKATERWFWFHGGDVADDCVDTFELRGDYLSYGYDLFNCGECDEAFDITRTMVDRTCNYTYFTLHGWDPEKYDAPDEEIYDIILLFDEIGPSGNPNMDNKMLVIQGAQDPSGAYSMNYDFALGHIYPRGESYSLPADYDYQGKMCLGTGE